MDRKFLTVGEFTKILMATFAVMMVATWVGAAVALPGLIAESARRFRDPRESTPEWQQRKELETPSGPITYRFIDRGVMLYSKTDPLCDDPHKFVYKGLRYYNDDIHRRDGYPYEKRGGPVARTITWRVLGRVQGVHVMDYGAIESIEDPWMVFVGISPGFENRSDSILEHVAEVVTTVLHEKRSDLEAALKVEDTTRAQTEEEERQKREEERRKKFEKDSSR